MESQYIIPKGTLEVIWFCLISIKFPRNSHMPFVWSLPLVLELLLPYYYGHIKLTCDFLNQPLGLPLYETISTITPAHPYFYNFYPLILAIYLPVFLFVLLSFLLSSIPPTPTLLHPAFWPRSGLNQLLADGAPSKDRAFRVFTLLLSSLQDSLKLALSFHQRSEILSRWPSPKYFFLVSLAGFC